MVKLKGFRYVYSANGAPKVYFKYEINGNILEEDVYGDISSYASQKITEYYCQNIYGQMSQYEYDTYADFIEAIAQFCA